MRVLMLGWEFPPHISGGLGTACQGLTDAMGRLQVRILFVLPRAETPPDAGRDAEAELRAAARAPRRRSELVLAPTPSELTNPYQASDLRSAEEAPRPAQEPDRAAQKREEKRRRTHLRVMGVGTQDGYDGDLSRKIYEYADRCVGLTRRELFDVIHAHDWMTFPAAMAIAEFSGRPIVVHVHATEYDRSGENINLAIYDIERRGMQAAARVVAVSERTKRIVVERYSVPARKVSVIYNGIDLGEGQRPAARTQRSQRVVLFLGRITMQKGPEYFVRAAARVAEQAADVKFVIAGTGDQLPYIRTLVEAQGLAGRVEFPGFLRGPEVDRAYQNADVYAMPSVSEPFGLTALEAARHGVPVVLSNDSGVAEVLKRGALKVDFWDVEMMAKMIVALLERPALADKLRRESIDEVRGLTWENAARKCIHSYHDAIRNSDHYATAALTV